MARAGVGRVSLALLLCASGSAAAGQGTLTVVVKGVESDAGRVVIALLDSAESYESEDRVYRSAKPLPFEGEARASFAAVAFGGYAVKVFHDANDNGKLDTNLIGIPKEPFGFSNNVMGRFGPPDFEDARFAFDEPQLTVEIELRSR